MVSEGADYSYGLEADQSLVLVGINVVPLVRTYAHCVLTLMIFCSTSIFFKPQLSCLYVEGECI